MTKAALKLTVTSPDVEMLLILAANVSLGIVKTAYLLVELVL